MTHSEKFLHSSLDSGCHLHSIEEIENWYLNSLKNTKVSIKQLDLSKLDKWNISSYSITHSTGHFFSILPISIKTNSRKVEHWQQPIINQPEFGYLGFITKKINGVLHFLVQAKIEPGNLNKVQLSPTLQATKSNYTRKHKGKKPKYLDYFKNLSNKIIYDQLQSEQGARFLKKRNRNIIIEIDENEEIKIFDEFIWMTLYQLKHFMRKDNVVNMDTRTVVSSIIPNYSKKIIESINLESKKEIGYFGKILIKSSECNNENNELSKFYSFLIDVKSSYWITVNNVKFNELDNWTFNNGKLSRPDKKFFEVIGCEIMINNREIKSWCQPMIKPTQKGLCVLLSTTHNGVLYFLFQAKVECGNLDLVEMAPTVQTLIGDYRDSELGQIPYLSALNSNKFNVIFDVFQSEEGGRFYEEQNRNILLFCENIYNEPVPKDFFWMSLTLVESLIKHNNIFNIQSRSILSMLNLYD